jgi:membrane fusion protein (multidrug efflux system)
MQFSRRFKRVTLGFLALIAVVAFVLTASWRVADSIREKRRYETERADLRPPEPILVTAELRNLQRERRFAADLRPWMRADIPAEVSGRVTEVLVEAGDVVVVGQPLVRLDDTLARIAVDQARARLEESRRLLAEAERLLKSRAISATAYEAQAAAVRLDQATLAETAERLSRHTVRASFPGSVDLRMVDLGEAVNANQPVARVVDLEKLRVEFFVSEPDLAALAPGATVPLVLEHRPDLRLEPVVQFVSPAADPGTRLFRVEAVLPNDLGLPAGLQGIVMVGSRPFPHQPFVPSAAVEFSGRESFVWKVTPSGIERGAIRVGPEIDGFYPVLEGLSAGDQVEIR